MQLGLAIIVDDAIHNLVRALQLRVVHEVRAKNPALKQIPHITLKQPFHAKTIEPIEVYFDDLVAKLDPIPIRIEGLGWFDDDRVIFLQVVPNPQLETLRRRILADLQERFHVKPRDIEDDRYLFHLTLAYGLLPEEYSRARETFVDVDTQLDLRFDTLGLFYYTGDEWVTYKRARLTHAPIS